MELLSIIKVGGKVVEEPESLNQLLTDFVALPGYKLLVHGGGRTATQIAAKLGIETVMVEGRRVTDAETLKVVTMVYAGLVNKTIVASLQALNCNAIGLTGADLNLILAKKRENAQINYGFVGDIVSVQANEAAMLIKQNVVPVVSPITHNGKGLLLNTNADTVASELARALSSFFDVNLIYCFEKPGVMLDQNDEQSVLSELTYASFKSLQKRGVINEGMIPKLDNGFAAIKAGVKNVVVTNTKGLSQGKLEGTFLKMD